MSLRLASLDALVALSQLYAVNWSDPASTRLWDLRKEGIDAMSGLRRALGLEPIYAEHDDRLDDLGLLGAVAERLARNDKTKLLAVELNTLIAEHRTRELHASLRPAAE